MGNPAYFLFNVTAIHDPAAMKPYQDQVQATIARYEGTVIIAGGDVESIEGPAAQGHYFVLRFNSMEAAKAWYGSAEYQSIVGHRHAAASTHALLLAGLPL